MCIGLFQLHGRIWDALSYFCLYLYVQVQVFGILFLFYFLSFVRSFIHWLPKLDWKKQNWMTKKMMKWFRSRILFAWTLIEWVYRDNICPFVFNRFFFFVFFFTFLFPSIALNSKEINIKLALLFSEEKKHFHYTFTQFAYFVVAVVVVVVLINTSNVCQIIVELRCYWLSLNINSVFE